MIGQTDRAVYQIWQGKSGNYTRFVNHSCAPNSQFERFVWLGKQRIVLVSKGVEAGEEITVDYSDTYWKVSFLLFFDNPHPPPFDPLCWNRTPRLTVFFFFFFCVFLEPQQEMFMRKFQMSISKTT